MNITLSSFALELRAIRNEYFCQVLDFRYVWSWSGHKNKPPTSRIRIKLLIPNALYLSLPLVGGDLPFVGQVRLVSDQHDDDVGAPLCPDIINPLAGLVEAVGVRNVVDDHRHCAVSDVRRNERPEPFLASGVPQLETDSSVLEVHCFGQEVYPDSGPQI